MSRYDDIIGLSRPLSRRPKMTNTERAAQFSPFSALASLDDELRETDRMTEAFVEYSDDFGRELDLVLDRLRKDPSARYNVTVTYFVPDRKKEGGAYEKFTGNVRRVDDARALILFEGGKEISVDSVVAIGLSR